MSRSPAVVCTTQSISAINQMSASSFSRLFISQRQHPKASKQLTCSLTTIPILRQNPQILINWKSLFSSVTEAHSEALPWKLEPSSVLFIREDLAQKYFMISTALNTDSSQYNEVKLQALALCEDSSGSFFNQAAWSSLHLQRGIAHYELVGKSSVALRETEVVLEE